MHSSNYVLLQYFQTSRPGFDPSAGKTPQHSFTLLHMDPNEKWFLADSCSHFETSLIKLTLKWRCKAKAMCRVQPSDLSNWRCRSSTLMPLSRGAWALHGEGLECTGLRVQGDGTVKRDSGMKASFWALSSKTKGLGF